MLPLSLYLISFIICFDRDAWYVRTVWYPFLAIGIAALIYVLKQDYADQSVSLVNEVTAYSAVLFGLCMVSHGEMVRNRPSTDHLTLFYLYVALGGALGGVLVNLVAPHVFNGYWELHLVVVAVGFAAVVSLFLDKGSLTRPLTRQLPSFSRWAFSFVAAAGLAFASQQLWLHKQDQGYGSLESKRGFFGVLHAYEQDVGTKDHYRALYYGRIRHGDQYRYSKFRNIATAYYGQGSGVSFAIRLHPQRLAGAPMNVGAIGLGVGTIASYGQAEDEYTFYEINPDVEYMANRYFSYLGESKADINVVIGDGRTSLAKQLSTEGSKQFDVLVLDAFNGDAIPVHLLTEEAFVLYWQHLKSDGVLALHITNRHLDLTDVVRQLALKIAKQVLHIENLGGRRTSPNEWVIMTSNSEFLDIIEDKKVAKTWLHDPKPIFWSDDFSNLFDIIK